MVTKILTEDGDFDFGIEARNDAGYRVLAYSGFLGGGKLTVLTKAEVDAPAVPVPDATLCADDLDNGGKVVQQICFVSAGNVIVMLAGAVGASVIVSVI